MCTHAKMCTHVCACVLMCACVFAHKCFVQIRSKHVASCVSKRAQEQGRGGGGGDEAEGAMERERRKEEEWREVNGKGGTERRINALVLSLHATALPPVFDAAHIHRRC
jgi:hypothetical protein